MLTDDRFYKTVASADFAKRYYGLCSRFPLHGTPGCKCTKADVMPILAEMERTVDWCSKDNSYSTEIRSGTAVVRVGFVIQKQSMVECWFLVEQAGECLGSNYSVIAFEATKASRGTIPSPTYPRPFFYTLDDLREILGELFVLADTLLTLVKPLLD